LNTAVFYSKFNTQRDSKYSGATSIAEISVGPRRLGQRDLGTTAKGPHSQHRESPASNTGAVSQRRLLMMIPKRMRDRQNREGHVRHTNREKKLGHITEPLMPRRVTS
jgi:hypothetical protein